MKKNYSLLLALILLLQIKGISQSVFTKSFGGSKNDSGRYLDICPDGGYILVGYSHSFSAAGDADIYVVRTDATGQQIWAKTYGGTKEDYAYSVVCVTGGYVVVGTSNSYSAAGDQDAFMMKLDDSGNEVWMKFYGGAGADAGKEIRATSDGGFIVTGWTSLNNNYMDAMLLKTDADGNQQWIKNYGLDAYLDNGYSVRQTSDGGYVFVGKQMYSSSDLNKADTYLVRTDENGNKLWEQTYGGTLEEEGQYIALTSDGGFIFASDSKSTSDQTYDAMVIKTDGSGNQQWKKLYGGNAKDIAKSIEPTSDGGYILGGITRTNLPNPNYWLVKLNSSGDTEWDKNYGGDNHEHLYLARPTSDGGYIVIGHESSLAGVNGEDFWLIKTNSVGAVSIDEKRDISNLISVFPNPNKGTFRIALKEQFKNSTVSVMDGIGRVIYQNNSLKDSNQAEIVIDHITPGIYLVELTTVENRIVKKITVN